MELDEDIIETGRINQVLLRTICLPEKEITPDSHCVTSGLKRNSKVIDAVPLDLLNYTFCDNQNDRFELINNEYQLCASLQQNVNNTTLFHKQYEIDSGGPLICLDQINQKPIFTGVASSDSLSSEYGHLGIIKIIFFSVK